MISPNCNGRWRATVEPFCCSAMNAKYCPLMRETATTGMVMPGCVLHVMRAQMLPALVHWSFHQDRLGAGVHLRRDKVHLRLQQEVPIAIQHIDGRTYLDFSRALRRYRDVNLQAASLIDRGQWGGIGYAVANMNWNVAHDAIGGGKNAVV